MAPALIIRPSSWLDHAHQPSRVTPTTDPLATKAGVFARQATVTVTAAPAPSNDNGNQAQTLSAGAIAGIIIGSVIGILLLIWIVRSCFNLGAPPQNRESMYHHVKPERHHHHHSRHSSRPRRYSYTSEVSVPPAVMVPDATRTRSRQRSYLYEDDRRGRRYKRAY
ncbi:hypothetical protein QQS21_003401 [Conoideocrella luteorostrata]|uniref:Uncharacterized protein n=1 Tax=Conoideocrella luteorostrata TaxID=1105319 RepID=A0AAJ0G0K5_9HYPO|nr:hypothetical protein QQS21_003401 [Conoideocrella luteorostrata]